MIKTKNFYANRGKEEHQMGISGFTVQITVPTTPAGQPGHSHCEANKERLTETLGPEIYDLVLYRTSVLDAQSRPRTWPCDGC